MQDTISRQAAIDYFVINVGFNDEDGYPIADTDELRKIWTEYFDGIPPAEPEKRTDKRTETHECDLPSAQQEQPERCSDCEWWTNQPEIIRCKDCKHFHYDMPYVVQGIPVLGHEVCDFWGDGCKTNENGFCSYAERKESEGEG